MGKIMNYPAYSYIQKGESIIKNTLANVTGNITCQIKPYGYKKNLYM